MYALEEGVYTVNEDYPGGHYLRPNGYGGQTLSPFDSIPSSLYYMIVTITTVGYGEFISLMTSLIVSNLLRSLICQHPHTSDYIWIILKQ